MSAPYIERREHGFYVAGTRVPIDRIVFEYWEGEDPVAIQTHFPVLTLDEVNGAIAFYLEHREEVDASIEERKREEEKLPARFAAPPELKEKLQRARSQILGRR